MNEFDKHLRDVDAVTELLKQREIKAASAILIMVDLLGRLTKAGGVPAEDIVCTLRERLGEDDPNNSDRETIYKQIKAMIYLHFTLLLVAPWLLTLVTWSARDGWHWYHWAVAAVNLSWVAHAAVDIPERFRQLRFWSRRLPDEPAPASVPPRWTLAQWWTAIRWAWRGRRVGTKSDMEKRYILLATILALLVISKLLCDYFCKGWLY